MPDPVQKAGVAVMTSTLSVVVEFVPQTCFNAMSIPSPNANSHYIAQSGGSCDAIPGHRP